MSRYTLFDRNAIELRPIAERGHRLLWTECLPLDIAGGHYDPPGFAQLVEDILVAREQGRPVIVFMGAHPIKLGLSRFLIDLIDRNIVTHLATTGAGIIHDFELALVGGTSEDVAKWIASGQFGLWRETSRLNDLIASAAQQGDGLAETVGRIIDQENWPFGHLSIAAAGWRRAVPITCHVSIGSDIVHPMANCSGAALGQATYTDFLIFAHSIAQLEGGVFLNIGSAVVGPEVYLKALSMARNVARQRGNQICTFSAAVFDLVVLPDNWHERPPDVDEPAYYYRPWKTILQRTIQGAGKSFYFRGDHRQSIPALWKALVAGR